MIHLKINNKENFIVCDNFPINLFFKILFKLEYSAHDANEKLTTDTIISSDNIIFVDTVPEKINFYHRMKKIKTTHLGNHKLLYFKKISHPITIITQNHIEYKYKVYKVSSQFVNWLCNKS